MIELRNYHVSYSKKHEVVKGVSIKLEPGRIGVLLGPNGSGKSTFIKAIVGAIKKNEGNLLYEGELLERKEIYKEGFIAYVPQNQPLPHLSVYETILLGRMPIFGYHPRKIDHEKTIEIIERLSISHLSEKMATSLSGGEAQKVAIARALVSDPKFIIFDEPTSNLDIANQLLIMGEIRKLSSASIHILIAMHDLNMALEYGDRFYCLKDGELLSEGGEEIITENLIKKMYGVDAHIEMIGNKKFITFKENENL
ncbi:MAG: ABC transporter ATP-binding protein [Bacilli bacterium]|nr:ABC transporter ATP-binding protein [Bacilli bacterium]